MRYGPGAGRGRWVMAWVGLLTLFGVAPAAGAQDAAPDSFCWSQRDAEHCATWLVFEPQGVWDAFETTRASERGSGRPTEIFDPDIEFNVGGMINVGDDYGIGVVGNWSLGSGDGWRGMRVRGRRWLGGPRAVDVELGAYRTRDNNGGYAVGPSLGVRLRATSGVQVFARWDRVAMSEDLTGFGDPAGAYNVLNTGIALDGIPGVVGTGVLAVLAVLAAIAFSGLT